MAHKKQSKVHATHFSSSRHCSVSTSDISFAGVDANYGSAPDRRDPDIPIPGWALVGTCAQSQRIPTNYRSVRRISKRIRFAIGSLFDRQWIFADPASRVWIICTLQGQLEIRCRMYEVPGISGSTNVRT